MGTLDLALNKLENIKTSDSTIKNVKKKQLNQLILPSKMQIVQIQIMPSKFSQIHLRSNILLTVYQKNEDENENFEVKS